MARIPPPAGLYNQDNFAKRRSRFGAPDSQSRGGRGGNSGWGNNRNNSGFSQYNQRGKDGFQSRKRGRYGGNDRYSKRGRYDNRNKRNYGDKEKDEFDEGNKHTVNVVKSESFKQNKFEETDEMKANRERDEQFMQKIKDDEKNKQKKISEILNGKMFKPRSRWHDTTAKEEGEKGIPPFPTFIPYGIPEKGIQAILIRTRIDEITKRLQVGIQIDPSEIRSPSPPPVFDKHGRRSNTRIQRMKKELNKERSDCVEKAIEINPMFKPPPDFRFSSKRVQKKIPIPVEKYPDYNFIGLIIGPRGATQKRLERESGAKIAIRGKGSIKVGKGIVKPLPGQEEPLHVLVSAENDKALSKACAIVEKLLIPVEEGKNEFKRKQLRELARIHGTLRDDNDVVDDSSLSRQLKNYGTANILSNNEEARQDRRTLHGHNVEKYDNMDLDDIDLEDQFEQFAKELAGESDQPFYQYFSFVKEKPLLPPGCENFHRNHYLYNIQKRDEKVEEKLSEEDKMLEDEYFSNRYAPGTLEEEQYTQIMQQQKFLEEQRKVFDLSKKENPSRKKKKKKKVINLKSDVPPWLQ